VVTARLTIAACVLASACSADEARRRACAAESVDVEVGGTWTLSGEGERSDCRQDKLNDDLRLKSGMSFDVVMQPSGVDQARALAKGPALASGAFTFEGKVDGSCVDFATTETGSGFSLDLTFAGDAAGRQIEGDFSGSGPESCELDGTFRVTISPDLDDDCLVNPCQNGGACSDGQNRSICNCAPGFTGPTCTDIDDCPTPNPCHNGGVCIDGVNSYTCDCPLGWTGPTCAEVDDCVGNDCDHGTCVDGAASYTCDCAPGWQGTYCDRDIDECADNTDTCDQHASCDNTEGSYTCDCNIGYEGDGHTCRPSTGCSCSSSGPGALAGVVVLLAIRRRKRG
jgi:MYXO-CTERM domain-containing protein